MPNTPSIATIGEILVEFISHRKNCGLSRISDYSGPYPSGAPAIFLDQAARMGADTQMFGGVGDDGFGRIVLDRLTENGVGIGGVTVSPEHSTGVAFVSYYDDGTRDFIFHLTNTASDQFAMPPAQLVPHNTYLHVSAASLGNASLRAKIMKAVREVDSAGGWISCDPNARPELMRDKDAHEALTEVMARSTCLLPSTSDLEFLCPDLSEEAAIHQLLRSKAQIIALKRGAAGATVVSGDTRYDFAGHTVKEIDPTGAGDCFGGTFIGLLAQGVPLFTAAERANAAGALAVTQRGPMEGNSSPQRISDFLDQQSKGNS